MTSPTSDAPRPAEASAAPPPAVPTPAEPTPIVVVRADPMLGQVIQGSAATIRFGSDGEDLAVNE